MAGSLSWMTVAPAAAGQGALTTVRVDLRSGPVDRAIPLAGGTPVTGVVTLDGAPLPYGLVEIVDPNSGALLGRTLTDSDGRYNVRVEIDDDADAGESGDDTGDDGDGSEDTGGGDEGDATDDTGDGDTGSDSGDSGSDSGDSGG
jgi:hypothetical protein